LPLAFFEFLNLSGWLTVYFIRHIPLDISGSTIKCIMILAKNLGTMISKDKALEIANASSVSYLWKIKRIIDIYIRITIIPPMNKSAISS